MPTGNQLEPFFSALHKLGFQPTHILDVGANRAQWTRSALRFFPNCFYTLVEPQGQLRASVEDLLKLHPKMRWITAGAGAETQTLKLTLAPRDESSTFTLSSQEATRQGLRQIDVPVVTLNDIVASSNVPVPEMVKIDAEGFDLKVLSGASALIGKTEIFLLETAVCYSLFENTLARNVATMEQLGYMPFDITELNRSPKHGVLWLCEMAFIKRDSALLKPLTSY